jgi:transposase
MKTLSIREPAIVLGLQDEIRRNDESRYDHRLHALLLIAQGMSCSEVAKILGDSTRTVQHWLSKFEQFGLQGIVEGERSGRPTRLTEIQKEEINQVLRDTPEDVGMSGVIWDGKTLSAYIEKTYNVTIGVRQCQRLFRSLGFRLRKPRPIIGSSDPEKQDAYKKTP